MNAAQFLVLTAAAGAGLAVFVLPRLKLVRLTSSILRSRLTRHRSKPEEIIAERVEPFAEIPETWRRDGPIIDVTPRDKMPSAPDLLPYRRISDSFSPREAEAPRAPPRSSRPPSRAVPDGTKWWHGPRSHTP
jgi:hypothetical protein